MKSIVYCVASGKSRYAEMALGLARSLKLIGDTTPRVIATDIQGIDWERYFDAVVPPPGPRHALDKLFALETTDADRVLALDVDMLAFQRVDPIFDFCQGRDLAIQGGPATTGRWHGADIADACRRHGLPHLLKFNGGLIYYERTTRFQDLLTEMRSIADRYDETGFARFRGNASEEVCMSLAMARHGVEWAIPPTMDFMSSAPGAVGPIELDVLRGECRFLAHMPEGVRLVRPILFHASSLASFRLYWQQLDKLEQIARHEDSHPPGYRSRSWRLRRSLERRLLKMRRRA